MAIKLVAFDWNGTILDDNDAVIIGENKVLKAYNLPPITIENFRQIYTIPIRNYWIHARLKPEIFDRESDQIQKIFFQCYEPLEDKSGLRAGARELLIWLSAQKIESIIFSNHVVGHIEKQLGRLHLDKNINKILARESLLDNSHMHTRSKDTKLAEYVQALGLQPTEVLTVGDTVEEVEIGKKFGYHTAALTLGWNSTERLQAVSPDYLIETLDQIRDIIKVYERTK